MFFIRCSVIHTLIRFYKPNKSLSHIIKPFISFGIVQIVQSETSPVTCTTTAVRSLFKHHYHVYGQQEATFHDVDVTT